MAQLNRNLLLQTRENECKGHHDPKEAWCLRQAEANGNHRHHHRQESLQAVSFKHAKESQTSARRQSNVQVTDWCKRRWNTICCSWTPKTFVKPIVSMFGCAQYVMWRNLL